MRDPEARETDERSAGGVANGAAETPARSEVAEEATDGPVRADGGTDGGPQAVAEGIGRVARLPVPVLGFAGGPVIEPPPAFYRLLRSNDRGSSPRTDGRPGDES